MSHWISLNPNPPSAKVSKFNNFLCYPGDLTVGLKLAEAGGETEMFLKSCVRNVGESGFLDLEVEGEVDGLPTTFPFHSTPPKKPVADGCSLLAFPSASFWFSGISFPSIQTSIKYR